MLKEKPISFSGSMIRALKAGKKTQTRRLITPQPRRDAEYATLAADGGLTFSTGDFRSSKYGMPGTKLWVRETARPDYYGKTWADIDPILRRTDAVAYKVDFGDAPPKARWFSPRYMPRWAARTFLEVVKIRAERLQMITDADALAEGIVYVGMNDHTGLPMYAHFDAIRSTPDGMDIDLAFLGNTPQAAFARLWDSINEDRGASWAANPWVWVVEFKEIQQ